MIKIGYVPKLKIAHEIYLGDTIVENVSGNAYLKVISMLDEEVEIEVPTFHLPWINYLTTIAQALKCKIIKKKLQMRKFAWPI